MVSTPLVSGCVGRMEGQETYWLCPKHRPGGHSLQGFVFSHPIPEGTRTDPCIVLRRTGWAQSPDLYRTIQRAMVFPSDRSCSTTAYSSVCIMVLAPAWWGRGPKRIDPGVFFTFTKRCREAAVRLFCYLSVNTTTTGYGRVPFVPWNASWCIATSFGHATEQEEACFSS
jgi:hypothetical protein